MEGTPAVARRTAGSAAVREWVRLQGMDGSAVAVGRRKVSAAEIAVVAGSSLVIEVEVAAAIEGGTGYDQQVEERQRASAPRKWACKA